MTVRETDNGYILKLSRGESVVETLTEFCKKQGISSGTLSGIGAVENTSIGYYNLSKKEYDFKEYSEIMEVVSMTGNVALLEGEPFLHIHIVLSDNEKAAYGGHLKEATVAVTLEIFLTDYGVKVEREYDEVTGLNLWNI